MAATIIYETTESDIDGEPKTYDLLIENGDYSYWKFGSTSRTLKKRFAREPSDTKITIRRLWRHKSILRAESHERGLFRKHKGDRPFIGKMGPLIGGGNTEVYSHDVAMGEPPPCTFDVLAYDPTGFPNRMKGYADFDPWSRWDVQYRWVPSLIGPSYDAMVVREKSTSQRVVICSSALLDEITDGQRCVSGISKRLAECALNDGCWVSSYADAYHQVARSPTSTTLFL